MPNVSEIANMFGSTQSNLHPGGPGKAVGRWNQGNGNVNHSSTVDKSDNTVPPWKKQLQQSKENQNSEPPAPARKPWERNQDQNNPVPARKPWEKPQDQNNAVPARKPWEKPQDQSNAVTARKPWEKPQDQNNPVPARKPWEKPQDQNNAVTARKPWEKPQDQNNAVPARKPWEKPQDQSNPVPARKPWEKPQDQNNAVTAQKPWEKNQGQSNSVPPRKPWETQKQDDNVNGTDSKWKSNIPPKPDVGAKPHVGSKPPFGGRSNTTNEDTSNHATSQSGSLQRNKSSLAKNLPSWKKSNMEENETPRTEESNHQNTGRSWNQPKEDKPPSVSSSLHNKTGGFAKESFNLPSSRNSFSNKPNIEENTRSNDLGRASRSGSNYSQSRERDPSPPQNLPEPATPSPAISSRDRPSFLHHKKPAAGSGVQARRRLPLPPDVQSRPAPVKPKKPLNVKLPGQEATTSSGRYPSSPANQSQTNIHKPTHQGANEPNRTPSFLAKKKEVESSRNHPHLPDLPDRNPGLPDLPSRLPPVPHETSNAPALPDRPPLPPPNVSEPPALPPLRTRPPPDVAPLPSIPDDIYIDTEEETHPPPMLPPMRKQDSIEMIEPWSEGEEEGEGLYDQTPDDTGFSPPSMKLPPPPSPMHQKSDDGRAKLSKEEEKRRKEAQKKDKEMRKKFKLPKEGEILPESTGTVKGDVKGSGKDLTVNANEKIEIIRTSDNPKSKWLIRNMEGTIGYVDSDKIAIDTDTLKSTMQSFGNRSGSINEPPMIPTEDEEGIYDETPDMDDDVYEEL